MYIYMYIKTHTDTHTHIYTYVSYIYIYYIRLISSCTSRLCLLGLLNMFNVPTSTKWSQLQNSINNNKQNHCKMNQILHTFCCSFCWWFHSQAPWRPPRSFRTCRWPCMLLCSRAVPHSPPSQPSSKRTDAGALQRAEPPLPTKDRLNSGYLVQ